jgi:hypothetical protein
VNIYIFGSKQYTDDINVKLNSQDISIYLKGEIIVVDDANQLLDIIKNKNDDDIFLIDDEVISKKDRKKSIFSFFKKQKFLIDEKDIEQLANSTLEANSLDDAVHQIFEIIEDKSMKDLDDIGEMSEEEHIIEDKSLEDLNSIDSISTSLDDIDSIQDALDDIEEDEISNEKEEINYDELSQLDLNALEDAFKDFKIEELDEITPVIDNTKCVINNESDISLLTQAFEQLLKNNKKITITLEVSS